MNNPSVHTFTKLNWNLTRSTQEVNEINTVIKPEKHEGQCSSTNHTYQIIQKEKPREKNWTIRISIRKPMKPRISTTRS